MIILLICILVLTLVVLYILNRKTKKVIVFIGPRSTGKTVVLHQILENKTYNTVPTLETYTSSYITDTIPNLHTSDVLTKYNICNEKAKYFFFFSDENQLKEILNEDRIYKFLIYFVFKGKKDELVNYDEIKKKISKKRFICLENDGKNLLKFF
ncbi:hypothetical protein CWI36_0144p0040 [Hamiltosporidium magnivora]|uniref:Signal recognition particle receptor subunit beta n=1 Tax=Hamiltosporidium magnivora TaxID=148818 RepID=A0A4Q9LJM3_9MICR|nr:hypothetical protein CWI36_0144p0040 [Hamiltosporidium magnivora]